ncbi:AAA family ATPase [candidate division KSB1 bacterium]|nr:AAA family ATPase [candidate division KSB1 bacterium]
MQKLNQKNHAQELFVCKTDHYLDVFAVSDQREELEARVLKFLQSQLSCSSRELKKYRFRLDGPEAIRHFYERFIGLQDYGVINQAGLEFRNSFSSARKLGITGPVFNRLYQRGVWLAEKVRIELNAHRNAIRPETVVTELAQKIFGDLQEHSALIITQSSECEDYVKRLHENNLRNLLFVDGQNARLREVAEKYRGKVFSRNELSGLLSSVDLILLFNEEFETLLNKQKISRIMSQRKNAPLLWATLFEPNSSKGTKQVLSNFYNIYYYDKEDLQDIVASNLKQHQKITGLVNQLIDKEIDAFINWIHSKEQYRFGNIIGKSEAMQKILEIVARIAQTNTSVLIDGESGTGKELIAQAIHDQSMRSKNPFIVVNCGAMPDTLLESELFGHVRGAFTGATSNKKGLFEVANHGTIFLDEIGETSPATQVKLLRFLQEGEIKPVGSNETVHLDVRVITATNRDLQQMVEEGNFRQDLYYRLNVIQITIPPLRDRKEDILPLAEYFVKKYATKINKTVYGLDEEAQRILKQHDWYGNVRELENAIERAVALCFGDVITKADLPPTVKNDTPRQKENHYDTNMTLKELERRHIAATLREHDWDYELVTKILGIGRTTLWRKMKEYEISSEDAQGEI